MKQWWYPTEGSGGTYRSVGRQSEECGPWIEHHGSARKDSQGDSRYLRGSQRKRWPTRSLKVLLEWGFGTEDDAAPVPRSRQACDARRGCYRHPENSTIVGQNCQPMRSRRAYTFSEPAAKGGTPTATGRPAIDGREGARISIDMVAGTGGGPYSVHCTHAKMQYACHLHIAMLIMRATVLPGESTVEM